MFVTLKTTDGKQIAVNPMAVAVIAEREAQVTTITTSEGSEFSVADSPLAGGLLTRPFELREGRLAVPEGPGLGIELDDEAIEQLRVR